MMRHDDPIFHDALFRNKRKHGGFCVVEPPTPPLEAPVADTHAHLEMLPSAPLALARCAVHGVGFICDIVDVCEKASGRSAYNLLDTWLAQAQHYLEDGSAASGDGSEAERFGPVPNVFLASGDGSEAERFGPVPSVFKLPHVRVAVGCHPHNARHYSPEAQALLVERLRDPLTCALGEVGLDFHYDFSPRDTQREVFRRQIALAHEANLPLILHLREAHEEAFAIMEAEGFPAAGTLLHCYNLDTATLEPWLARDCFVALGGPLTFKKSEELRGAALSVPRNRLLIETDAPFMAPEPMRGMSCGPEHVIFTAARLAEVFSCEAGEARRLFLEDLYRSALNLLDRGRV
ncbi:MAG: TatD family hydrolase [Eggerthellaceae bacterium]|nr:TatD family hydrolase [Eggerthellaceae bacterium]